MALACGQSLQGFADTAIVIVLFRNCYILDRAKAEIILAQQFDRFMAVKY